MLKLLIIPLLLAFIHLTLLSYPYFFSKINRYDSLGFLSLVEEMSVNSKETSVVDNHLIKGEKFITKVKAKENNFGIVLARFVRFGEVSDSIAFRLKEEGQEKWYYENVYRADQFLPNEYFTFGFPPIENSKNKNYVFEIESLAGASKHGVGVMQDGKQVALVYKHSSPQLKDIKVLPFFILKKTIYAVNNVSFWQILPTFLLSIIFVFFVDRNIFVLFIKKLIFVVKNNIITIRTLEFLRKMEHYTKKETYKKTYVKNISTIKVHYFLWERKCVLALKKLIFWFTSTKTYSTLLNTNLKKRLIISLLIFLTAFLYRFSASLVSQSNLFYYAIGGGGDYDQLIKVSLCAVDTFCPEILIYNFLFMAPFLGLLYKIFGFIGGVEALLYLMIVLSALIALLPYVLLSRKSWFSIGGFTGSFILATNDFLTNIALGFPSDNSSVFTFSIFYIVYLLTLRMRTIRWLILLGLVGVFDGFNKVLFLINNLGALLLFIPIFFFEQAKKNNTFPFVTFNLRILVYSALPLVIFLLVYLAWEFIVFSHFNSHYFLRGLVEQKGGIYTFYTTNTSFLAVDLVRQIIYYSASTIIMLKRLIDYTNLQTFIFVSIFLGLLFSSSTKNFSTKKLFFFLFFSILTYILLFQIVKNNQYMIHKIFDAYIYAWTDYVYFNIFLFIEIVLIFVLHLKYSAIRPFVPIATYVTMLIILTRNAPFPRLHIHVVVWSVIFFAYIIDWIVSNTNKYSRVTKINLVGPVFLAVFMYIVLIPKIGTIFVQLSSGFIDRQNEVRYLRWVNATLPKNAIILGEGKSDFIIIAENVKRPIIYSALWKAPLVILPDADYRSTKEINLFSYLKDKENFRNNSYIVLEKDSDIWRKRLTGETDSIFSPSSSFLHSGDYTIRIFKINPNLKKGIYEVKLKDTSLLQKN